MRPELAALELAYQRGQNPLAYLPLADEYRRRRMHELAIEICHEGMRAAGRSARGLAILAHVYYDQGQYDSAVEALREALRLAPDNYDATVLLAKSYTRQRDFVEARRVLQPLLASNTQDHEVQLLARVIHAEISQSITELNDAGLGSWEEFDANHASQLYRELEDLPGVDAIFEFGLQIEGGDVFFEDFVGQELDEDIKVTLIECTRLTTKLGFGEPRQAILETHSGRIFFRMRGQSGLMALAAQNVKLGRLRFLMDQYLQAKEAEQVQ